MTSGQIIGGRYRLGDRLGRGGMAEVRLALDIRLGRGVAIKQLRTELAANPDVRARFHSEARSAASLSHPNIVRVFDIEEDVDPVTQVPTSYLVLELVEGKTLAALLRTGTIFSQQQALRMAQQLLAALQHSHDSGIVHHDIKPGNVMLTGSGRVKVMDFGIARNVVEAADSSLATVALGTPKYLSPEQASGHTGDARSDLYSTGCLLYELLVGRPPFVGPSRADIISQHLHEAPRRPSFYNPQLSSDVDFVILRSLAKKPEDRYQTAQEMSAEISSLLAAAPAVVPAAQAAPVRRVPTPGADQPVPDQPRIVLPGAASAGRRPAGRRRALVSSGLAAMLLSVGGLGIYATHAPGASDTALNSAAILGLKPAEAQELTPEHRKAVLPDPAEPSAAQLPSQDQRDRSVKAGVARSARSTANPAPSSRPSAQVTSRDETSTAAISSSRAARSKSAKSAPAPTRVQRARPTTNPRPSAPTAPTKTAPPRHSTPAPVAVPRPRDRSDQPSKRPQRVHTKKAQQPVRSTVKKAKKVLVKTSGSSRTGMSARSQHPPERHQPNKPTAP